MRKVVRRLVLAAALGGCSAPGPGPQAFCAAQADRDPAVKALIAARAGSGSFHGQPELDAARATTRRACLQRQGILPSGDGVAPPAAQRSDTLFGP